MNLKISIIATILVSFLIIFLINDNKNLETIIQEFKINEDNKIIILNDLKNVEERYESGPFYTEEIVQKGIEVVSSNEEIIDDKKHIRIILKSLETNIYYEKVFLSVILFNDKKETVHTLRKEFNNMQPEQIEEMLFDISLYKASYFKIHYQTEGGKII